MLLLLVQVKKTTSADERTASRNKKKASEENEAGIILDGKLLVQKEQPIKFSPCSPGQIIEMAKYLGVDPFREFYLLTVVRRAVIAPFPHDWAVGEDRLGNPYYYNKYTMKVINSHPLSEVFIDWVASSRQQLIDETELRRKDADDDEEIQMDMGTPWLRFGTEDEGTYYWFHFQTRKLYTDPQYKHILSLELDERNVKTRSNLPDPKKQAELEQEMKIKKAMQKYFATGLRKFFLLWQLHMMQLRAAQAKALVKSGISAHHVSTHWTKACYITN
jgi:hypothetical protein